MRYNIGHLPALFTNRMASATILSEIQFSNTYRTPIPRRPLKFAILQIIPDATPHTAWPRNPFYKEINSSGCCGRPHGNGPSDWVFRVHCIPEAYIHTLKGCDAPETPNITDRFLCGLPSTKHSFLIPVFASGILRQVNFHVETRPERKKDPRRTRPTLKVAPLLQCL